MQHNGSWFIHVLLVKDGYPLDPEDEYYDSETVIHQYKSECECRNGRGFSGNVLLYSVQSLSTKTSALDE